MCLYEQLVEHPEAELYIMNGMRAMLRVDQQTIKESQGNSGHAPENITFATKQPRRGHTY
jgi:hypothetical protein